MENNLYQWVYNRHGLILFYTSQKMRKNLFGMFQIATKMNKDAKFLTATRQQDHDLIFVRHAESLFNHACEQYRLAHNIPYVWKQLCNHEGFDQTVLYNTAYMDCPLTQKGTKQCKKTKTALQNVEVDCILVSPQLRALQTCKNIFQDRKIPTFVEPILTGPLRSCSDVNMPLHTKKSFFEGYNFTPTESKPALWFLDYLSDQQRKICEESFRQKNIDDDMLKRFEVVELLKRRKIQQNAFQYRKRIQRVKNMLKEYRLMYKKIAVVTHYYTIEYISAMNYEQNGVPKYYMDIKNCVPYYARLSNLLSVEETQSNS